MSQKALKKATGLFSSKKTRESVLPKEAPHDRTLTRASMAHEFGEAGTIHGTKGTSFQPFATHVGVRPILEENLASHGDPDAANFFSRARLRGERGDKLVHEAIRRAGGTADSPLPKGGKHERAVNRMLSKHPEEVGKGPRRLAVGGMLADRLKNPDVPRKDLTYNAAYIPSHVHDAIQNAAKSVGKATRVWASPGTLKDIVTLNRNRLRARSRLAKSISRRGDANTRAVETFVATGE